LPDPKPQNPQNPKTPRVNIKVKVYGYSSSEISLVDFEGFLLELGCGFEHRGTCVTQSSFVFNDELLVFCDQWVS
jgi:hypothetical protein